jgi:cob(I)alamin adenosyltransferase
MKIYTRTGDGGDTALLGGARVPKDDLRVAACGDVDELNALLGLAAAQGPSPEDAALLHVIQRGLFALGARLADPTQAVVSRRQKAGLGQAQVAELERAIDEREASLPPLDAFILPGGAPLGALLHLARTVCRRAERRVLGAREAGEEVSEAVLVYLNRLSDWLFVAARVANARAGTPDLEWQPER